ncbi:tRNA(His) guanylyltransferase Thg1 family protein [Methanobacterium paludis]|uniref:tRNAHis guanylyltransferase catalytic domain-containing protein n=1 Tax=Methanobacterium paludis (strain DSM 25820 / JCM 18151 / SWAN1) TaxID=868131 RepID=F6D6S6_METPW|nr:tRNA(His) guanylyltransferase Thg1 family protein [Methanobacterium paludis]AEG18964.1 protein of unknown function DUF549 [Methanobacterium paludis]
MKQCEIFSTLKVPCGSKIVLRIDGRKFSRLSSDLEFKKPYDINFIKTMVDSCLEFSREFSPSFVYTFSDEINILLSEIPFAGRIEKLNSVFPSFISSSFFKNLKSIKETDGVTKRINMKPVSFDSRVIPLSEDGVVEYFKNRQDEAWRNCLNGYAYWTLRKEHDKKEAVDILDKKKSSQLHDIIFDKGTNIAEVPAWQRRGVGLYRKKVQVEGFNPISNKKVLSERLRLFVDWNVPIFDEDFFRDNNIL